MTNLKKTYYYMKRNGVMPTIGAALERVQAPYFADYHYNLPSDSVLEEQRKTFLFKMQALFFINSSPHSSQHASATP